MLSYIWGGIWPFWFNYSQYSQYSQYWSDTVSSTAPFTSKIWDFFWTAVSSPQVPGVFISRLVRGGLAESTGLLGVNDEILEVNGIDVAGKSLDQVNNIRYEELVLMYVCAGTWGFMLVLSWSQKQAQHSSWKKEGWSGVLEIVPCIKRYWGAKTGDMIFLLL